MVFALLRGEMFSTHNNKQGEEVRRKRSDAQGEISHFPGFTKSFRFLALLCPNFSMI